ncbi:TonB-dependent siderophore receptor [Nitrospirillum pindoramense]|uniref:Iron complex outermembrane receptor protein n=1 Tax=Nitrospirillum amazonense TaxID=28077 RepID=A0A560GYE9_9PROT|nr:TonB-dependent siderophore receptor [Nitrospirillum amazonense]TWB38524.1 iron complex outermembrane receptor protein [Nitrospirillum amazonense]
MTIFLRRPHRLMHSVAAIALVVGGAAQAEPADQPATVIITGVRDQGFRATDTQFGAAGTVLDTPASVSVVTRDLMDDQQARRLSDLIRNDASIGENYAPEGYYEDIAIRGFPLDLATGLQINGLTIAGEQPVALENKQRVEFLKGLAGVDAGVVAPGGLVDYVTKRPADVRSLTLGTDNRGGFYSAVDVGSVFGERKQYGLRLNAAHEDIASYVDHADGYRNFGSIAGDWRATENDTFNLDLEYQRRVQHSVSGYQLLGGTALPALDTVSPERMLGAQSWTKPVTINALNLSGQYEHRFSDDWRLAVSAGHSRTVIDDNVAFAYGCYNVPSCAAGESPGYYFAPNGDFDVYDYRSPNDAREDDQAQALLLGKAATGAIGHSLTLGASVFRRTVTQTDYVYDYVGSDNIYNPTPLAFDRSPNNPGANYQRLDSRQYALIGMDRVDLGALVRGLELDAGVRGVFLRERAYDVSHTTIRNTAETLPLPQAALVYKPLAAVTLYASHSRGLSLGGQAPAWATNASEILSPSLSWQDEVGAKYDWNGLLLGASVFRLSKAYEYAKPDDSAYGFTYVRQGTERHDGLELNAAGQVTEALRLTASATFMHAVAYGTGTPAYDGHQAINVPHVRTALYADYTLPHLDGLALLAGWQYVGARAAARDAVATAPAYHLFNAGLRYAPSALDEKLTLRLSVDNLLDRRYWKDVGESAGDAYLHLGAPRTARFTIQYSL